jgi:hypothetical protein
MPPRWPRVPTRQDPEYRKLDDRMTFAVHVAAFTAINSGMWFFHIFLKNDWNWLTWVTLVWLGILVTHLIYISAIADYSETPKST